MPATFTTTSISGLLIIEPRAFPDERGFFMETFKVSEYSAHGVPVQFVQDNHSKSSRGTLRGLHYQTGEHAQGKLVRCTHGRLWDVAVDIRKDSPTYGKWDAVELSAENHKMFWIPSGFAHGFIALEDDTELQYKCTAEYNKESEGGIRWDDPTLAIDWPITDVLVSEKDAILPYFGAHK